MKTLLLNDLHGKRNSLRLRMRNIERDLMVEIFSHCVSDIFRFKVTTYQTQLYSCLKRDFLIDK